MVNIASRPVNFEGVRSYDSKKEGEAKPSPPPSSSSSSEAAADGGAAADAKRRCTSLDGLPTNVEVSHTTGNMYTHARRRHALRPGAEVE